MTGSREERVQLQHSAQDWFAHIADGQPGDHIDININRAMVEALGFEVTADALVAAMTLRTARAALKTAEAKFAEAMAQLQEKVFS